jgi:hypothetical protein
MNGSFDIVLVTCGAMPNGDPDDDLLREALSAAGLTWTQVAWDDSAFDWSSARCALLRTPWDYYLRPGEFVAWADRAATQTQLHNSAPLLRWNHDKRYLRELESAGTPIVPTAWLENGAHADLDGVLRERGWTEAVTKPVVSADAWQTQRIRLGAEPAQPLPELPMMAQPYLASVEGDGERCHIFINGGADGPDTFSHVVRKLTPLLPRDVEAVAAEPREDEVALARSVLDQIPGDWLYARVDTMRDAEGTPLLSELELIEPTLFFTCADGSAERFVRALQQRL